MGVSESPTPPTVRPADNPQKKIDRLVAALLFGGIAAGEGARRLVGILNAAESENERQRLVGYFRAFMLERHAPVGMVESVAKFIMAFVNPYAIDALPWVSTGAQRRLYLFALIAGTCGRTFGMAKNRLAAALGTYPRAVDEFTRKALRYYFMTVVERATLPEPGRYRRMTVYALTKTGITESLFHPAVNDALEEMPWLLKEQPTREYREKMIHEVLQIARIGHIAFGV